LRISDTTAVVAVMSVQPTSANRTVWQLWGSAAKAGVDSSAAEKPKDSAVRRNEKRGVVCMKTPGEMTRKTTERYASVEPQNDAPIGPGAAPLKNPALLL
jgi:hypothetical protein